MDWFELLNYDTTANEQPEWDVVSSNPNYTYADEYDKGFGGAYQEGPNAVPSAGVELFPNWSGPTGLNKIWDSIKQMGSKAMDFAGTPQGLTALLLAALAASDRRRAGGGGTGLAYQGPANIQRTMAQGKYGPIARYAAEGGLMQAYAQGGQVFPMQDGGFVMTKRAVDGAGGMGGLRQMVPQAVPIRGPGHGTSDSIPAYIQGRNGRTPAAVSNGEAYVPPGENTEGLYALMKHLERKA